MKKPNERSGNWKSLLKKKRKQQAPLQRISKVSKISKFVCMLRFACVLTDKEREEFK